jgi:hypothetical protein
VFHEVYIIIKLFIQKIEVFNLQNYILMHKDTPVVSLSIGSIRLHVNDVYDVDRLPIGTRWADENTIHNALTMWNDTRCIPAGRPNYAEFLKSSEIENTMNYISRAYMCSLTDCYWFKPEGSSASWKDVNFRDNGMASELHKYLFYNMQVGGIDSFNSPDITTNGMLQKMWEIRNGQFHLVKRDEENKAIVEYVSSCVINCIGIDRVPYEIVDRGGIVSSSCPCFITSNGEEFVPFDNVLGDMDLTQKHAFEMMCKLGYEKEVSEMLLCDYLIGNVDRHSKNYGFIVDSDTQNVSRVAPLFDHGDSILFEDVGYKVSKVGKRPFEVMIRKIDTKYLDRFINLSPEKIANSIKLNRYVDKNLVDKYRTALEQRLDNLGSIKREMECGYERDR